MVQALRRMACVLCCLALLCTAVLAFPTAVRAEAAPPEVEAGAYALIDAQTGQVLVAKNEHQQLFPASITKIMTLALTLEAAPDYAAPVEVSYRACHELIYRATHIALQEGEVVSVGDLLYGTQIESANDGANALAEYGSGSIEAFAERMNQKGTELGLQNTHFTNPSGQPDTQHVTSAYDMAKITRWALTVPGFREIFASTDYTMPATNIKNYPVEFSNRNPIINPESPLYYPGITGSKMGYIDDARYTLVTSAQRGDTELICVVMHCDTDAIKYASTIALLDYGFNNFSRTSLPAGQMDTFAVPVFGGGAEKLGELDVCPAGDMDYLLHNSYSPEDVQVSYEVPEEYVVGQPFEPIVRLTLPDGSPAQSAELGAAQLSWTGLDEIFADNTSVWQRAMVQYPAAAWFVMLAFALLLLGVLLRVVYVRHRRSRRRKKRRAAALATMPIRIAERPPVEVRDFRRQGPSAMARSRGTPPRRPAPAKVSFEVYDRRSPATQRRVGGAR